MSDGLHRLAASVDPAGSTSSSHGQPQGALGTQLLLTRAKLAELIGSVSPGERFDPPVELVADRTGVDGLSFAGLGQISRVVSGGCFFLGC